MLCTVEQFKARYGLAGYADDEAIALLIAGVSAQLARAAGRLIGQTPCLEKTSLTVLLSPGRRVEVLFLPAWPVISISSVKEAYFEDFDAAVGLTEKTDYQVARGQGILRRIGGSWLEGTNAVQAIYVGGYVPAGVAPGLGETALPADLVEAALQQAGFTWQRRASLGLAASGVGGGSVSAYARDELLPGVKAVAESYARRAG